MPVLGAQKTKREPCQLWTIEGAYPNAARFFDSDHQCQRRYVEVVEFPDFLLDSFSLLQIGKALQVSNDDRFGCGLIHWICFIGIGFIRICLIKVSVAARPPAQ